MDGLIKLNEMDKIIIKKRTYKLSNKEIRVGDRVALVSVWGKPLDNNDIKLLTVARIEKPRKHYLDVEFTDGKTARLNDCLKIIST